MDDKIWNILTNFEVHDISDLSDHCAIKFSINAQIREKGEIRFDPSDKGRDEFKLIRSNNTGEISSQLGYEKKLSESFVDLNSELKYVSKICGLNFEIVDVTRPCIRLLSFK